MSVRAWTRDRLVVDPVASTPVRMLWDDYQRYCLDWGFPVAEPGEFVRGLHAVDGTHIVEGGRGRLRRMLSGAYLARAEDRRTA